jgi:hypothetical protein
MHEPYPDGPGDGDQANPRGGRQPDYRRRDEWFRPQRGEEREPGRRDVAGERDRGRHGRQGERRRPAPNRTRALNLQATSLDLNATSVDLPAIAPELLEPPRLAEGKAGRKWVPIAGSVLFLIDTIVMADGFAQPVSIGSRMLVIFIWLVSVVAIAALWLRASPRWLEYGPLTRVTRVVRVVRAEIKAQPDGGDAVAR